MVKWSIWAISREPGSKDLENKYRPTWKGSQQRMKAKTTTAERTMRKRTSRNIAKFKKYSKSQSILKTWFCFDYVWYDHWLQGNIIFCSFLYFNQDWVCPDQQFNHFYCWASQSFLVNNFSDFVLELTYWLK